MIIISGVIGSYEDENGELIKGVELVDVIAQVASHTDQTDLVFKIRSQGGLVEVGELIGQYMDGLIAEGKTITTIGDTIVASIATIPYLKGQTRHIIKGTEFLIHNPYTTNAVGDAEQLAEYSKHLAAVEKKMAVYYSSVTGLSASAMDLLMKDNKPMTPEKAVELGFAHEVIEGTLNSEFKNLQVIACTNTPKMDYKNILKKGNDMVKELAKLVAKAKGKDVKNLSVTTEDGKTLEVEGDTITVGALVTLDGAPTPASTYVLADGSSFITDAEGKITEVIEVETVEAKVGDLVYDKEDKEKLMVDADITLGNGDKVRTGTKGQIIEIVKSETVEAKMGDIVKDDKGEIVKSGESVLADGTKVKTNDKGEIISMESGEPKGNSAIAKENEELKKAIKQMEETQGNTDKKITELAKLMGSNYTPPARTTVFGKRNDKDDKDDKNGTSEDIRANRDARKKKLDEKK